MNEFFGQPVGILTKARADTLYAVVAGKSGGQTLNGGTAAGENLILNSTSDATKGQVRLASSLLVLDEANVTIVIGQNNTSTLVGIGTTTPQNELHISGGNGIVRIDSNSNDAAIRFGRLVVGHFTIANAPILVISATALSTSAARVDIGGGSGVLNVTTEIDLYTAVNTTTVTGTRRMQIGSDGGVAFGDALAFSSTTRVLIQPEIATRKGLSIKGFASQSANLQDWQDSSAVVLSVIAPDGSLGLGITAPTALLHLAGNRSATSWTTTGRLLAINAATLTDTSGSGTIAFRAVNSIGIPTLIGSSAQTLTMSVNTYIAGAPVASTNVTQTAHAALFVDTGDLNGSAIILRAAASQAVDVLQMQTSANIAFFSISTARITSQFAGGFFMPLVTAGVGTPAYAFATDATTGIYRVGAGSIGFSASAANIVTIDANGLTMADAKNFIFNTSSGTKHGTATNQKQAFWNATPIVQPTTAIAASTFVANTSLIANDSATFDGYTIGQVVKALRNLGLLA